MQLSEADARPGRRTWRWLAAATAMVVVGAVATRIVGPASLTPRMNAVIALGVFGGLLGLVSLVQWWMSRRDGQLPSDKSADS